MCTYYSLLCFSQIQPKWYEKSRHCFTILTCLGRSGSLVIHAFSNHSITSTTSLQTQLVKMPGKLARLRLPFPSVTPCTTLVTSSSPTALLSWLNTTKPLKRSKLIITRRHLERNGMRMSRILSSCSAREMRLAKTKWRGSSTKGTRVPIVQASQKSQDVLKWLPESATPAVGPG